MIAVTNLLVVVVVCSATPTTTVVQAPGVAAKEHPASNPTCVDPNGTGACWFVKNQFSPPDGGCSAVCKQQGFQEGCKPDTPHLTADGLAAINTALGNDSPNCKENYPHRCMNRTAFCDPAQTPASRKSVCQNGLARPCQHREMSGDRGGECYVGDAHPCVNCSATILCDVNGGGGDRRFCPCMPNPCNDVCKPLTHGQGCGDVDPNPSTPCKAPLQSGHKCEPVCDPGYVLQGQRTCLNGVLTDTAECIQDCGPAKNVTATWVLIEAIGVPEKVSFSYGVTHSHSVGNNEQWGTSTSRSVGGGFSFFGLGASVTVKDSTSHSFARMDQQTFEATNTTTRTLEFQPGVVWQFKYDVLDRCGTSEVFTNHLIQTNNAATLPCCLPGYFQDPTRAHGKCVAGSDGEIFSICNASRVM